MHGPRPFGAGSSMSRATGTLTAGEIIHDGTYHVPQPALVLRPPRPVSGGL